MSLLKRIMGKSPQMNLESNKALFIGLWNPQEQYSKTRHNIGADILKAFCLKSSINFELEKSGSYKLAQLNLFDINLDILLPMVSMNISGQALKNYMKYNEVNQQNTLVIHDDIDLPFGRLRLKNLSSDGGHNGIKSINSVFQSNEYFRLKVGVGRPPKGIDPADFVLSKFYTDEREEVDFLIEDSIEILNTFLVDKNKAIKEASERRIIDVI